MLGLRFLPRSEVELLLLQHCSTNLSTPSNLSKAPIMAQAFEHMHLRWGLEALLRKCGESPTNFTPNSFAFARSLALILNKK